MFHIVSPMTMIINTLYISIYYSRNFIVIETEKKVDQNP